MATSQKKKPPVFKYRGPNYLLNSEDGWYLSYNPLAGNGVFDMFAPVFGEEALSEETALYDGKAWYILKGDFRDEYSKVFHEGLDACVKVYKKHKETHRSGWSTD